MSSVSRLNNYYSGFFKGAGFFSVSPYLFAAAHYGLLETGGNLPVAMCTDEDLEWRVQKKKGGLFACIVLTIIPVLPLLTAITFGLALIGATIAALSTLITYPLAAALDCAIPENNDRNKYSY